MKWLPVHMEEREGTSTRLGQGKRREAYPGEEWCVGEGRGAALRERVVG